jgi:hypothetical protein
VLESSAERITSMLAGVAVVLDVGGWGHPFERADWVLDLLPYETRGLYDYDRTTAVERFSAETWIQRDICQHEPWPFGDKQFDFAVCSQTLEDIRDPIWVCHELQRVARAGYIECPSRAEEQSWGVHGPWVGWSHHRWLVDVRDGRLRFAGKPGVLHSRDHFPDGHASTLAPADRVVQLWWQGSFEVEELQFFEPVGLHRYLRDIGPAGNVPLIGGDEEASGTRSPQVATRRPRSLARPIRTLARRLKSHLPAARRTEH